MDLPVAAPNKGRTHCKEGHPLSGENLQLSKRGDRLCRACEAVRRHARQKQRRSSGKLWCGYPASVVANTTPEVLRQAFDAISKVGRIAAGKKSWALPAGWRSFISSARSASRRGL
jgi:hypothetical protein